MICCESSVLDHVAIEADFGAGKLFVFPPQGGTPASIILAQEEKVFCVSQNQLRNKPNSTGPMHPYVNTLEFQTKLRDCVPKALASAEPGKSFHRDGDR
uniref:Uncharacterized protein n=1 Tax=Timema cristinae TaxID=61476 RepID=A0A7R9GP92_TIMCR|nr:unnamed protein product [Timema cristinae]